MAPGCVFYPPTWWFSLWGPLKTAEQGALKQIPSHIFIFRPFTFAAHPNRSTNFGDPNPLCFQKNPPALHPQSQPQAIPPETLELFNLKPSSLQPTPQAIPPFSSAAPLPTSPHPSPPPRTRHASGRADAPLCEAEEALLRQGAPGVPGPGAEEGLRGLGDHLASWRVGGGRARGGGGGGVGWEDGVGFGGEVGVGVEVGVWVEVGVGVGVGGWMA